MKQLLDLIPTHIRAHPRLWATLLICALVLVPYAQVRHFDFVNFDDINYIVKNEIVGRGLTWEGVRWAFTTFHMANWHPLTWLSYMLDVSIFGLNAGGFHLINLLFHAVNTGLVLVFAEKLTGSLGAAAFTAALFGLHPLHVESVAWISERKDVVSTFFYFLSLIAWMNYVETRKKSWYATSMACHTIGLLSKPMGVTLPIILLLLDIGPLNRLNRNHRDSEKTENAGISHIGLLIEKAPFFVASLASSIITLYAQSEKGAMANPMHMDLATRFMNASRSYVAYLFDTAVPTRLAVFYPLHRIEAWSALVAVIALIVATSLSIRKRNPLIAFGWFWYLVTLLPVIGIIQVGLQAHADRYTYIPLTGIFLSFSEVSRLVIARWPGIRHGAWPLAGIIVVSLGLMTHRQVAVWNNSETLLIHTIAVTTDNYLALGNLGAHLIEQNRPQEALLHLEEAARIQPGIYYNQINMAYALALLGRQEEALRHFEAGIARQPHSVEAYNQLGIIFYRQKNYALAISLFTRGLKIEPHNPSANYHAAIAHLQSGQPEQAIPYLKKFIEHEPDDKDAQLILCLSLNKSGRAEEARECFKASMAESNTATRSMQSTGVDLLKTKNFNDQMTMDMFMSVNRPGKRNP